MKNTLLIICTFICALSLNSAVSHAALETKIVTSEKHGITAWLIEDHSMPLIAMKFGFRNAGSAQDTPETQGLARIMSNSWDSTRAPLVSDPSVTSMCASCACVRVCSGEGQGRKGGRTGAEESGSKANG